MYSAIDHFSVQKRKNPFTDWSSRLGAETILNERGRREFLAELITYYLQIHLHVSLKAKGISFCVVIELDSILNKRSKKGESDAYTSGPLLYK